jgi:hypothetical protein
MKDGAYARLLPPSVTAMLLASSPSLLLTRGFDLIPMLPLVDTSALSSLAAALSPSRLGGLPAERHTADTVELLVTCLLALYRSGDRGVAGELEACLPVLYARYSSRAVLERCLDVQCYR